ncbi:hydroxymethylglutaryl-CoA lyase [Actinomycetes bacterium M1A6_2h]
MKVTITDVVLRDGLQDEPCIVDTADKLSITHALSAAGVTTIEAVSFVSPARVPQMADAADLAAALPLGRNDIRFTALALNGKGVDNAVAAGFETVQIAVSAGAGHSQANAGRSTQSAIDELSHAVRRHPTVEFIAGISTAFNCPFDGPISSAHLVEVVAPFVELGLHRVGLADTLGTADTAQVLESVGAVRSAFSSIDVGLHLHNAYEQALATAVAAAKSGIVHFDSALGGYGGCPFAPGAHGNVSTEDLVAAFHSNGIDTGIDVDGLVQARTVLESSLARSPRIAVAL